MHSPCQRPSDSGGRRLNHAQGATARQLIDARACAAGDACARTPATDRGHGPSGRSARPRHGSRAGRLGPRLCQRGIAARLTCGATCPAKPRPATTSAVREVSSGSQDAQARRRSENRFDAIFRPFRISQRAQHRGSPGGEVLAHTHYRSSRHGADKADRKAERTRRSTQQAGPSQPRKGVGFQSDPRRREGPIDTL